MSPCENGFKGRTFSLILVLRLCSPVRPSWAGDDPAPNELDLKDELTGGEDKVISSVALVMGLMGILLLIVGMKSVSDDRAATVNIWCWVLTNNDDDSRKSYQKIADRLRLNVVLATNEEDPSPSHPTELPSTFGSTHIRPHDVQSVRLLLSAYYFTAIGYASRC